MPRMSRVLVLRNLDRIKFSCYRLHVSLVNFVDDGQPIERSGSFVRLTSAHAAIFWLAYADRGFYPYQHYWNKHIRNFQRPFRFDFYFRYVIFCLCFLRYVVILTERSQLQDVSWVRSLSADVYFTLCQIFVLVGGWCRYLLP